MKEIFTEIRQLYFPVQPTVNARGKDVVYLEYKPNEELQNFIHCFWELKSINKLSSDFTYRVIADGCIDIYFEINQPNQVFVMGFCNQYTCFDIVKDFHYFGIRFLPTMFSQLLKVDASSFSNKYVHLNNVDQQLFYFISSFIKDSKSISELIERIEITLIDYYRKVNFNKDKRLYKSICKILKKNGVILLEKELDEGLSSRQLGRLFHHYIGANPKTFCKVVRFQSILRSKPSKESLNQNPLFYFNSFYDQAHFIKDFKTFYGVTPAKVFNR
jgi:AraC-like DNA-binding protein